MRTFAIVRALWLALAGLVAGLPPAVAQWSTRLDVSASNRYVWRGISRASGLVAQPSWAAGVRLGRLSLEGGAVRHYELGHFAASAASETGGAGGLGEDDLWARAALAVGPARLQSGVVRYLFHGDPARGGLGSARNTTEVYGAVSLLSAYGNHSLEAWWDIDRVRGAFLRASTSVPILGWPFPPSVFAFVDGDIGLNIGQGPDASRPAQPANFAGRGITHAGLGTAVELHAGRVPGGWAAVALGLRSQVNFDDAVRANGAGPSRDFIVWVWTGVTLLMGGEARGLRQ